MGQGAAALTPCAHRIVERGFYSERDAAHVVKQILEAVSVTCPRRVCRPAPSPWGRPGEEVPAWFRGVAVGAAPSQIPPGRGIESCAIPNTPGERRLPTRPWPSEGIAGGGASSDPRLGGMKERREEGQRCSASQVGWRWGFYGNGRV